MHRMIDGRLAGLLGLVLALALPTPARAAPAGAEPLLAHIKAVGVRGAGNAEAGRAWKELVALGPDALPAVLAAMEDDSPVTANWLRTAADAIAERALAAGRPLPKDRLEQFVLQKDHAGVARRLAYEWLTRVDPTAPDRLLPGMVQDPSPELRRDAVTRKLDEAKRLLDRGDKPGATAAYRQALAGTSDKDQADLAAGQLKAMGVAVDLASHFGFVCRWHLAAPFDNSGGTGFAKPYPPEQGVDLSATNTGKGGTEVAWVAHATADPYGVVDLNKAVGKHKGAVAYAHAVLVSPAARPVQVRVGCITGLKVFLNGKELFAREEYHHGMQMDQYVAHGALRAGRNELLLKVCQNEQTEAWAQSWSFQVRLTDAGGVAVPWTPEPARAEKGEVGR